MFSHESAVREVNRLNGDNQGRYTIRKKWYGWVVIESEVYLEEVSKKNNASVVCGDFDDYKNWVDRGWPCPSCSAIKNVEHKEALEDIRLEKLAEKIANHLHKINHE